MQSHWKEVMVAAAVVVAATAVAAVGWRGAVSRADGQDAGACWLRLDEGSAAGLFLGLQVVLHGCCAG